MATTDSAPPVTAELLSWLERVFPDALPSPKCRIREVFIGIGTQVVIRKLRQVHASQTEQALSGKP